MITWNTETDNTGVAADRAQRVMIVGTTGIPR